MHEDRRSDRLRSRLRFAPTYACMGAEGDGMPYPGCVTPLAFGSLRARAFGSGLRFAPTYACMGAEGALLGALAIALSTAPAVAQTACTRTGSAAAVTVTCSGDQSAGIRSSDILGATRRGNAPPAFPGTGTPPTPAARDITFQVRELTPNPSAAAVMDAGIALVLGPPTVVDLITGMRRVTGFIPPPTRPDGLGTFTLDVDLGTLRIAPGATEETAIRLAPGGIPVSLRTEEEGTSLIARLRGDFRGDQAIGGGALVGGSAVRVAVAAPNSRALGDADIIIAADSRLRVISVEEDSAVGAFSQRGDATVRLGPRVSLLATSERTPFFHSRGVGATAAVGGGMPPGDARVTVAGGTAVDAAGMPIPNIRIDTIGGIGIEARAFGPVPAGVPEKGEVEVTTEAGSYILTTRDSSPGIVATSVGKNIAVALAGRLETRGGVSTDFVGNTNRLRQGGFGGNVVDSFGVLARTRLARRAEVTIESTGSVTTAGERADGIRLRSAGEAPAQTPSTLMATVKGRVLTTGNGAAALRARVVDADDDDMINALGNIDLTVAAGATIETRGRDAHGIDAETVDGVVTIRTAGSVTTRGAGGNAIRATTGDGTVAITVGGGRVFAAAAAATQAAAVRAQAPLGPDQQLFLTVAGGGAVEGELAVAFAGGSDVAANPNRILVQSGGSLTGALALGAGADLLENRGLLALRGSSQFGAGVGVDRFLQAGQFEPGGAGRVETVSLWGLETVEFAPGGVVVIDVDGMGAGARADRIVFGAETSGGTGPSVTLGGEVQIREMPGRRSFRTGETSFPIFGTDGGLSGVGNLQLSVISTGGVVRQLATTSTGGVIQRLYRLVVEDGGTELRLVQVTEGSFVCPDGDRNIRAVGAELDRLASLAELPEEFESLLSGLGDLPKGGPYERAVNLLHAEPYDALLQGSWHAERALVDALWEGCGGEPGEGGYCAFGGLHGRSLDRVGEAANADFEELALGPRGGVSRHLGELGGRSWQLRVGAAYEALDLEWREGARGRGDRLLGGVALHSRSPGGVDADPRLGGLDVGLALAGGGAWFETERAVDRLGIAHAEAEPELTFLGGHGRLLYRLGRAPQELGWYAEFGLEGSAVALWLESFSEEEETAGVLRLRVAEARELVTTVRPQLGLGGSWQWGELRVAPRARLGFSYAVGGADTPYRARWSEAPSPPGRGFTTWGNRENWLIEASGGLAVTLREQISLRLDYTGRISPDGTTRSHEGQLRAELRF